MKLPIIIAIVISLAAGGAYFVYLNNNDDQGPEIPQVVVGDAAVTIVRTPEGYEPKEVTVEVGDIVEWTNQSSEYHWPASDLHPTHGVYPEFDPLTAIAPGETWKFKFDKPGVWKYHDHVRANKTGTITVK